MGTVNQPSRAVDYSLGAFAALLRDLLDELGISRATVVGQSLGGGVAMQFTYQHRNIVSDWLLGGGGLGPDLNWIFGYFRHPEPGFGAADRRAAPQSDVGNKLGSWLTSAGVRSTHQRNVERLLRG